MGFGKPEVGKKYWGFNQEGQDGDSPSERGEGLEGNEGSVGKKYVGVAVN